MRQTQIRALQHTKFRNSLVLMALTTFAMISIANAGSRASVGQEIVDEINASDPGWEPMSPEENPFKDYTKDKFTSLLGISKKAPSLFLTDSSIYRPTVGALTKFPTSYDTRKIYNKCIHPVRDQIECSACWAFAIAQVVSDRFCIASNSSVDVVLSVQNLISCVNPKIYGCKIGVIDVGFQYMEKTGIMTDDCQPYTSLYENSTIEACRTKCWNSSLSNQKYQCKKGSYKVAQGADNIRQMLIDKGSIFVTFDVYEDFFNYKKGIYRYTTGDLAGYHAVKLIGWGYDWFRDTNYYIVQNSWGTAWGMQGFFNIAFGQCNVDKFAYTCDPLL